MLTGQGEIHKQGAVYGRLTLSEGGNISVVMLVQKSFVMFLYRIKFFFSLSYGCVCTHVCVYVQLRIYQDIAYVYCMI